jgi:hypothetical protein
MMMARSSILMVPLLVWLAVCGRAHAQQQRSGKAVVVTTPQQLRNAIDSGAAHVHITEHLDLRDLESDARESSLLAGLDEISLIYNPPELMSLTVRYQAKASTSGAV